MNTGQTVVLYANTDWYLWNFRRSLALALINDGYKVILVSPPGEYGSRFLQLGLNWVSLDMDRRSLNPLRELVALWRLIRFFHRERPVLVHAFTIKCAIYGAIAARITGISARISSIDGLGYVFSSRDLKARLLRPIVRGLFRIALGGGRARLILLNQDDVALFKKRKMVSPHFIRLIRGAGVDCMRFVPRVVEKSDDQRQLRVLLAARLLWDKGIREYVEAARRLLDRGICVRFFLAGAPDRGNPAAVPEDMLQRWVAEGIIEWLGHVDDMVALLQSVDVLVLPSYREGLPTSLIEAAACELPLVTCDVPGCREVVTNDLDGLLVPPRDAGMLEEAIGRLLSDLALRERLGKAARAKALVEFDERVVIRKTLAVYGELVTSNDM